MKYIASLHAYDCLDEVVSRCIVRAYPDYDEGPSAIVLVADSVIRSEGVTDPRAWLGDVLIALLERI